MVSRRNLKPAVNILAAASLATDTIECGMEDTVAFIHYSLFYVMSRRDRVASYVAGFPDVKSHSCFYACSQIVRYIKYICVYTECYVIYETSNQGVSHIGIGHIYVTVRDGLIY